MRITLDPGPRNIAHIRAKSTVILRVISGDCIIGREQQTLSDGGGLPVAAADGIVHLVWDTGPFWMAGAPNAEVEVLVP